MFFERYKKAISKQILFYYHIFLGDFCLSIPCYYNLYKYGFLSKEQRIEDTAMDKNI